MSSLIIKTKSYPKRCEICHQNDLFNQINGQCTRCEQVKSLQCVSNRKSIKVHPLVALLAIGTFTMIIMTLLINYVEITPVSFFVTLWLAIGQWLLSAFLFVKLFSIIRGFLISFGVKLELDEFYSAK